MDCSCNLLNITLWPSFHISVTIVSPGYTIPANLYKGEVNIFFFLKKKKKEKRSLLLKGSYRTLMSLYGPNALRTCFPEIPIVHRPCKIGWSNPPIAANSGRI